MRFDNRIAKVLRRKRHFSSKKRVSFLLPSFPIPRPCADSDCRGCGGGSSYSGIQRDCTTSPATSCSPAATAPSRPLRGAVSAASSSGRRSRRGRGRRRLLPESAASGSVKNGLCGQSQGDRVSELGLGRMEKLRTEQAGNHQMDLRPISHW